MRVYSTSCEHNMPQTVDFCTEVLQLRNDFHDIWESQERILRSNQAVMNYLKTVADDVKKQTRRTETIYKILEKHHGILEDIPRIIMADEDSYKQILRRPNEQRFLISDELYHLLHSTCGLRKRILKDIEIIVLVAKYVDARNIRFCRTNLQLDGDAISEILGVSSFKPTIRQMWKLLYYRHCVPVSEIQATGLERSHQITWSQQFQLQKSKSEPVIPENDALWQIVGRADRDEADLDGQQA